MTGEAQRTLQADCENITRIQKKRLDNNWIMLDVEYIHVEGHHRCFRKLAMISNDGKITYSREFHQCRHYCYLSEKDKCTFRN